MVVGEEELMCWHCCVARALSDQKFPRSIDKDSNIHTQRSSEDIRDQTSDINFPAMKTLVPSQTMAFYLVVGA